MVLAFWLFGYGSIVVMALILIDEAKAIVEGPLGTSVAHGGSFVLAVALWGATLFVSRPGYLLTPETLLFYPGMGQLHMLRMDVEQVLAAGHAYYFGQDRKIFAMVDPRRGSH